MKINASVNYHVRRDEPQFFRFDVDGIIGNLASPELETVNVEVNDVRSTRSLINFDRDGITFLHAPTAIRHFDDKEDWQTFYQQEVTALLTQTIGAKEVLIFDHTVRIDDEFAKRKPARNVHTDYSKNGAHQRLIDLLGKEKAADYRCGRFGFVNIWRPIENPITHSPLGFIHPKSMSPEDWMTIQLIYPDRRGEILGVAANSNHNWFYLSNMRPEEVAIFNIYDNNTRPFLAHSALDLANQPDVSSPRKSIETRTLVRYE